MYLYDKCVYDKCIYDKCTFMTNVFVTNMFMTSVFITKITEPLFLGGERICLQRQEKQGGKIFQNNKWIIC